MVLGSGNFPEHTQLVRMYISNDYSLLIADKYCFWTNQKKFRIDLFA